MNTCELVFQSGDSFITLLLPSSLSPTANHWWGVAQPTPKPKQTDRALPEHQVPFLIQAGGFCSFLFLLSEWIWSPGYLTCVSYLRTLQYYLTIISFRRLQDKKEKILSINSKHTVLCSPPNQILVSKATGGSNSSIQHLFGWDRLWVCFISGSVHIHKCFRMQQ